MKTISTKLMLIMFCAALIIISVLDAVAITAISKTTKDTVMSSAKPLSLQGVKNFDSSVQQYVTDLSRSVRSSDFSHAADEAAMVCLEALAAFDAALALGDGYILKSCVVDGEERTFATKRLVFNCLHLFFI